jgi:hypothetical protein
VQCRCTDISQHRDQHRPDTYCLVEPIAAAAKHPYITIMHRDGSDLVKVESINSHSANTPITRLVEPTTEIKAAEDREVIASAIGFSQNFSLDEAFKDALQKLNARPLSDTNRELSMIDVVSMGAAYGGFSGFNRLFVKVEQSSILHESGIKQGTRKKVHHTHKTVHTTLERSKRQPPPLNETGR